MTRTIHKYVLRVFDGPQDVEMPAGARVLNIDRQDGVLCLWAVVDPNARFTRYRFNMYFTGQPLPDNPGKYVGQTTDWGLVYHIFQIPLVEGVDGTYREV